MTLFKATIENKKYIVLEFNRWRWLKPCVEFNSQKGIEAEENDDKVAKAL